MSEALFAALLAAVSVGMQSVAAWGMCGEARGTWRRNCPAVKAGADSLLMGMLRGRVERRA